MFAPANLLNSTSKILYQIQMVHINSSGFSEANNNGAVWNVDV